MRCGVVRPDPRRVGQGHVSEEDAAEIERDEDDEEQHWEDQRELDQALTRGAAA
jgi:hypothetical protein